jgi:hypothetical protein
LHVPCILPAYSLNIPSISRTYFPRKRRGLGSANA